MNEPLIQDVSDTAFMVAAERALESERSDALFHDPLAGRLAGDHGKKIVASLARQAAVGTWAMAIRTCIIDDYILAAIAQGVTQVVNLGAGLDTRPYRMALPESLQWTEVDFPKVIEFKERLLANEKPRCHLELAKLDLSDQPARRGLFATLNRKSEKVLVITEGVVPYLTVEDVASLADDLRSQEHFELWIVDYFSPASRRMRQRRAAKQRMENAPWRFEPKDWFGLFAEHGWPRREIRYLLEEGKRRGRPAPIPTALKALLGARGLFMSARGRADMRQMLGYAVLQRTEKG